MEVRTKVYTVGQQKRAHVAVGEGNVTVNAPSRLQCAVACLEEEACTAANYDEATSQCELLTSPVTWTTEQNASTAIIAEGTGANTICTHSIYHTGLSRHCIIILKVCDDEI